MSNADSRSHDSKRTPHIDHEYHQISKNHSHHRRRHSIGQEVNSGKKRSSERGMSSNSSRPHPRAESKDKYTSGSSQTPSRSVSRKRRNCSEESEDIKEEDVWTEHKSSSGKIYYYNKRLDKSQWEKPEKGTLKRLKSERPNRKPSHSSKSHSAKREQGAYHHHGERDHALFNVRHTHPDTANRNARSSLGSSSNTNQNFTGSSPSTPIISNHSTSILSPTVPLTPTPALSTQNKRLPQYCMTPESPLMSSSQRTPSLFGGPGSGPGGPTTPLTPTPPILTYNKGATPLTPGMDVRLPQHSMVQYTQVYAGSPGTTPLQMVPHHNIASPVATQLANNFPFHQNYASSSLHPNSSSPLITSQRFQSPMSKLGRWVAGIPPAEVKFPDPESLQTLPHLPSSCNEMLSKVLADRMWTGSFDSIQKQVDHTHLEALSRLTVDHSYHSGQLARGLLSLECSRIKEVSRSVRLSDLKKIKEAVEKR